MDKKEKAIVKEKKILCILGIFFPIPPVLGVICFVLNLFGCGGAFVNMYNLSENWSFGYDEGGGGMSAAPIYLGLMAMVGASLIKDNLHYLFIHEEKEKEEALKQADAEEKARPADTEREEFLHRVFTQSDASVKKND